jgi:TPP-dependent indolepyruvate ferredoxin oxidoreductase alpha subunit
VQGSQVEEDAGFFESHSPLGAGHSRQRIKPEKKRKEKIKYKSVWNNLKIRGTVTIRTKNRMKRKQKNWTMEEARKIKISINSNKARETVDQVFLLKDIMQI